jgi:hypothetical protein
MDETKFKETRGLHSGQRSRAPTSCCKRSHVLWLKLNFHCTPSSQCVRQDVPSVLLLLSLLLFHMLWLQLNFHCTPSSQCVPRALKFVPQVPILFPNMVPSIILFIILSSHVLWLKLNNFHCTQVPNVFLKVLKCVPQHGPKYHTFISCALAKVELSLYPKFSMCSPTWSKVS